MVYTIDTGVNSSTVFYICYLNYVINCNGIPTYLIPDLVINLYYYM